MRGEELLDFGPGLRYLVAAPSSVDDATPIVACVHGISRNATDHFHAFAPFAQKEGWLLVAPLFEKQAYPDYQRLGRPGKGSRADLSLIDLIAHLSAGLGLPEKPIHLFGHSGGAQFCHRFVMVHPQRVARYAISAPGWYTFPDESLSYPYGLAQPPAQLQPTQPAEFLKVRGAVFVGSSDFRSGRYLRCNPTVDLHQGPHRLERARRWTHAMNARARSLGLAEPLQLLQLQGGAHSFRGLVRRQGLHEQAWEFLAHDAAAA